MEENLNIKQNKSGSTGLGIIIGLLIAVIVGMGAYIVFDKVIDKHKDEGTKETTPKSSQTTTTEKELDINSDLIKKLSKVVGAYKNDELSKYTNYFYKNKKVILKDEPLEFRLSLAARTLDNSSFKEDKTDFDPENGKFGIAYVSEDLVKDAYKNIFGTTSDYKRSNFDLGNCANDYTWSSTNNRYESPYIEGCGGSSCEWINSKVSSAKQITTKSEDKIEIYEKIINFSGCESTMKYYADYDKTNLLEEVSSVLDEEVLFNKYSDKASTYKYTFVKDSAGNYVFTSVEKVK